MSNKPLFGSGPKRDDDDEDERPASGSSPFASRQQPFGRSEDRKTGSSPSGASSSGSGGQRSPTFGGQSGSGGFGSRPGDPARPSGGTGSFPRPAQGGDRDDRSGSGTGRFGSSSGSGGSGSSDRSGGGTGGGFGQRSGGFGSSDRDRDKGSGTGSKPAERDDRPGGFGRLSGGFGSGDRDKDKSSSKPADKDDKAGGGILGRFNRGGDKKEDAKPAPAKLGPAGKPDDKGKKDANAKAGGGIGGLLGGLRRGGDESAKKPDANKPAAPRTSASGDQKSGGGLFSRLGGGGDKKEAPKPGQPAPLKSPGAAKPADKPQGGGLGGLFNRNKQDAPKDAGRPGAPRTGTGPLSGSSGGGTSGFQPQSRATGQMPGMGKPSGPAAVGGAKADAKAPAKVPDKGKSTGGGGLGARFGSLFGRGEAKSGTALVSQAAPPKGAKAGAMPPARLDRQAKPLDYSQTQVQVRHRGLSLDQKLDLIGYALIIAALVIIFGLLQPNEGTITTAIVNVLGGFFGAARYIIPIPVLAIGGWLLVRHFKENPFIELDILRIIGLVLMFLTLVTTCHFVIMLDTVVYSWEELAEVSAKFVDLQWGGGWVGDRLYYILLRISGEYGIVALLLAAWIVSIMLTFEITLAEVSTYVKSVGGWIRRKRAGFGEWRQVRGEAMVIQQEAKAKARAEREAQKAARAAGPVSIERPVAGAIPAAATLGAAGGIAALGDRPAPVAGAPQEPARLTGASSTARFSTAPAASAAPAPVAVADASPAISAAGPAPVGQRNRSATMPVAAPPVAEAEPAPAKEDTPLSAPVARPAPMPIGSRTASKPAPESVKAPEPDLDDEEDLEPVKPVVPARPAPLGSRSKEDDKATSSAPEATSADAESPSPARPGNSPFGKAPAASPGKLSEQPTEPEPDMQDTRPLERTGPMPASGARPGLFKPLGKETDQAAEKRMTDEPQPAPRFAALGAARPAASGVSSVSESEGAAKSAAPDETPRPETPKVDAPAERPASGLFGARPAASSSGPFARPATPNKREAETEAAAGEPAVRPGDTPARSPILGARPSPFSKANAKPDAVSSTPASGDADRAPSRPATLGSQPAAGRPAPVEPRPGVSTGTFTAARPAPKPGQSTPVPADNQDGAPVDPDDGLKYEPVEADETTDAADVEAVPAATTPATPPRPAAFVSGASRPSPFSPFGKRPGDTASTGTSSASGEGAASGTGKPLPAPIPSRASAFKPISPASKPAPQDDLDDDDDLTDENGENGDEVTVIPTDLPSDPVLHISEIKESGYVPPETRMGWTMPDFRELLEKGSQAHIQEEALRQRAKVIEDTLEAFGAPGRVVVTNPGPVITQFGVEPGYLSGRQGKTTRVKVGAIAKLDDDLALALSARSIRIEAPVPGKSYVGIEVPNAETALVGLRDIVSSTAFDREKYRLPIALGKSVDGTPIVADLTSMPHMLIAGTTGSGKSVCVNAIISCLLLENTPDDLQMIMVDPKRVELTGYNGIPHLVSPVVVDLERIVGVLKWVTREMEERYKKFSASGARNIVDYNGKIGPHDKRMTYLVVVVDELADLMMLAPDETEKVLTRLAQMARATGIHLIISTQRPSVDVVTGLIKANFPSRISFAVASSVDSRVVLDQPGAEKLLGRGDMLFQAPDAAAPVRMQGVFVSDNEINRITRHWKEAAMTRRDAKPPTSLSVSGSELGRPMGGGGGDAPRPNPARLGQIAVSGSPSQFNEKAFFNAIREPEKTEDDAGGEDDDLYQEAVDAFQAMGKISISLLQRRLRISSNRAARLIDLMKQRGVLGASDVAEADGDESE